MPLSSTPLALCAAVVAVALLVIATAPHNAVAGSVKVTSVASEQLNVQSIESIQGSQDGSGSAAFAYKIIQRRNDDNPSDDDYNFLHTSVLGKIASNLTIIQSIPLNPGGNGGDQWISGTPYSFFNMSLNETTHTSHGVACFPSNYGIEEVAFGEANAHDYQGIYGINSLPWTEYGWNNFAFDATSNSLYYTYTFRQGQGVTLLMAVVRVWTQNNTQDYDYDYAKVADVGLPAGSSGLAALTPEATTPGLPPRVALVNSNATLVVVGPSETQPTFKDGTSLFYHVIPPTTTNVLAIAASPAQPSRELLILSTDKACGSTLTRVSAVDGKVLTRRCVGNATAMTTGWRSYVALIGPETVEVVDAMDLTTQGSIKMKSQMGSQPVASFATGLARGAKAVLHVAGNSFYSTFLLQDSN